MPLFSLDSKATFTWQRCSQKWKSFSLAFFKSFTYTRQCFQNDSRLHISLKNGQKRCITDARPVVGAVTLLVNSTCREVMIIWCVSAVGCNIEVNPHFAEEALANSWAAATTVPCTSPLVVCVCSHLPVKSTRTVHVKSSQVKSPLFI